MRLFSASFSSLLLLPLLSSSAAAAASAPTDASLFLHPSTSSSGSDAAASISPAQLRQLLAYHLHLPGEEHLGYGARAAPRVWKWAQARVGDAGALFAGKQSAKLVVLANEDADVVPSALRQTHTLLSAPSASAFDALFESYRDGLESFSESASQGIDSLIALLHGEDSTSHEPSVEPLRFDAHLDELRASYGADSDVFAEAKASVSKALESLVAGAKTHAPNLAVVVLPRRDASAEGLSARDGLDVFSTVPRASRLSEFDAAPLAKSPKESDYIGKCFKSAKDLEKATAECSGHGKAVQTNHGARKCYTCQCKASKEKGRTTYWAGEACQKVDVSGPFVLIASTVVVLLLVTLGSVYYLMAEGSAELPSVLTGLSKTSN